jgi:hypothetical protein
MPVRFLEEISEKNRIKVLKFTDTSNIMQMKQHSLPALVINIFSLGEVS